jgi:hypothetical protein
MTTLTNTQNNNPVLSAEFNYQRFVIKNSRSGWIWILLAILMVLPAIAATLIFTFGLLFGLITPPAWVAIPGSWEASLSVILIIVAVSLNVVVTLVTVGLAHGSIRREKEKHTWILLRLTNIETSKIVLGKWWASLWALNGDNIMVIFLRVGLLAMACVIYVPAWEVVLGEISPYRIYFLLLLPLIVLQAAFDAALSAIIGVAAAIPDEEWGSVASTSSIVLRLFLSIASFYWYALILFGIESNFPATLILAAQGTLVTFILLLLGLITAKRLLDLS